MIKKRRLSHRKNLERKKLKKMMKLPRKMQKKSRKLKETEVYLVSVVPAGTKNCREANQDQIPKKKLKTAPEVRDISGNRIEGKL